MLHVHKWLTLVGAIVNGSFHVYREVCNEIFYHTCFAQKMLPGPIRTGSNGFNNFFRFLKDMLKFAFKMYRRCTHCHWCERVVNGYANTYVIFVVDHAETQRLSQVSLLTTQTCECRGFLREKEKVREGTASQSKNNGTNQNFKLKIITYPNPPPPLT